jgi:hypothetical protein
MQIRYHSTYKQLRIEIEPTTDTRIRNYTNFTLLLFLSSSTSLRAARLAGAFPILDALELFQLRFIEILAEPADLEQYQRESG